MIKIMITTAGQEIRRVDVNGHGGNKRGRDIVCAAVSAVTQTAISGLLHYCKECVKHNTGDGMLCIEISEAPDDRIKNIFNTILLTMTLGLKGIEREHPRRVKVEFVTK